MTELAELERIATRLRELGKRLGAEELSDEEAESLAREAADLATEGGGVLDAKLRELAQSASSDDVLRTPESRAMSKGKRIQS